MRLPFRDNPYYHGRIIGPFACETGMMAAKTPVFMGLPNHTSPAPLLGPAHCGARCHDHCLFHPT